MKIAHIADVHTRLKDRHEEYQGVFENLYKSLREESPDRILLAGDIVHSKTNMSPELVTVVTKFFKDLMDIAPIDLIAGNHDMNMSNQQRLDTLTPIVESVRGYGYGISYYRNTNLYEVGDDVVYGVFSLQDNETIRLKKSDKVDGKTYIALYHGPVSGCKLDNGYVMSDAKTSMRSFNNFDYVMLGDIHKMQYMRKNETAAYCGSLCCQNFGETLDKGYLMWDLSKKSSKFIPIENDYGFLTLKVKGVGKLPNVETPKNCRLRVIVSGDASKISATELAKFESKVRKKYKPMTLQVNVKPVSKDENRVTLSESIDIRNRNVQRELLSEYLSLNGSSDTDIASIIKIDDEISGDYSSDDYKSSVWSLNRISIENFMSYGKRVEIDFKKTNGVVGLFGDNASGKSVILDAILYNLFNKTARPVKNDELVNKNTDNETCTVELDLEIEGVEYRMIRKSTRVVSKVGNVSSRTTLSVTRKFAKDIEWEDLTETQRNETENVIRNVIGTYDDFLTTVLSTQSQDSEFVYQRPAVRSDNIIRFLGLDILTNKHILAKGVMKTLELKVKSGDLSRMIEELAEYRLRGSVGNEDLKKCNVGIKDIEIKIEDKIEEIDGLKRGLDNSVKVDEDIQDLEDKLSTMDGELEILGDRSTVLSSKIEKLSGTLVEFELNHVLVGNKYDTLVEDYNDYKQITRNIESSNNKLGKLTSALRVYKDEFELTPTCPTLDDKRSSTCQYVESRKSREVECGVKIEAREDILRDIGDLEKSKSKVEYSVATMEEQENVKDKISEAYINIESMKTELVSVNSKFDVKEMSISLTEGKLKVAKKSIDAIEINKKIKIALVSMDSMLKSLRSEHMELVDEKSSIMADIKVSSKFETDILKKIEEVKEDEIKFALYDTYCSAMHRDGLPTVILKKYISTINYEVNKVLAGVVGFTVNLHIEEGSTNIDVLMKYTEGDERPAILASGMERLLTNFAIRCALVSVSNMNKPDTWLIDEGFGVLDSNNLASISTFFDNVRDQFKNIVIITHIDDLKDITNYIFNVEKVGGISTVNQII